MDVQMPELDGYEATVAIRERERATNARPIPVIAMTANTSIEDRDRCLVSGMNDYIPKPVTTDSLRRMLARWTHRSLSAPDSPGPATTVPTTDEGSGDPDDSENTPLDIERALDYLDGNQEILRKVLCQFMETLPQLIGQVLLAAAAGDSGGLRLSAHNLKGAAANLCADPIRRTAEQIESLASAGRLELVRPALAELEQQANRLRDFMDSKPK
jgi:HPt (histidine-containing phosphotransfer) domain-containing protein